MTKVRYEEMLPHEIVEARVKCPIAYLPIGGLEWHGEHLPVGNDTLKAHALAVRCAEEGGGLAMPPLFFGENRSARLLEVDHDNDGEAAAKMGLPKENFDPARMPVSAYEQDKAYIDLLVHILYELESLGFKAMVILAGHYPLLAHARAAVWIYSLAAKARASAASGYELVRDVIPDAGDHAAKWETSLLMALRPELVDMSRLPQDTSTPLIGVVGADPRTNASPEYGRKGVDEVVKRVVAKAHSLLPKEFRSAVAGG
jgi:creatinine amidohydrolase